MFTGDRGPTDDSARPVPRNCGGQMISHTTMFPGDCGGQVALCVYLRVYGYCVRSPPHVLFTGIAATDRQLRTFLLPDDRSVITSLRISPAALRMPPLHPVNRDCSSHMTPYAHRPVRSPRHGLRSEIACRLSRVPVHRQSAANCKRSASIPGPGSVHPQSLSGFCDRLFSLRYPRRIL